MLIVTSIIPLKKVALKPGLLLEALIHPEVFGEILRSVIHF